MYVGGQEPGRDSFCCLANYYFLRAFLPQIHHYPLLLMQMRLAAMLVSAVMLILANQFGLIDSDLLRYLSFAMLSVIVCQLAHWPGLARRRPCSWHPHTGVHHSYL